MGFDPFESRREGKVLTVYESQFLRAFDRWTGDAIKRLTSGLAARLASKRTLPRRAA
jgi:hypothetical protein